MAPADLFFYSASIAIWFMVAIWIVIAVSIYKLFSGIQRKIERIEAARNSVVGSILGIVSSIVGNRRRGGDRYE
jgi:hypothetical protein